MSEDLKARVLELAAIAKQCPENLQEKCFELLLRHYLDSLLVPKTPPKPSEPKSQPEHEKEKKLSDENGKGQDDLKVSDLHVKIRKFLDKYSLRIDHLNQIFYKEGEEVRPLYEDLKTTKAKESQLRIAFLQALQTAIKTGNFEFNGENVRNECQIRKCYDVANFAANFKTSAGLLEGFSDYDKNSPVIRLSEEGRKKLADLIQELQ